MSDGVVSVDSDNWDQHWDDYAGRPRRTRHNSTGAGSR
jgi:hypothetical protein